MIEIKHRLRRSARRLYPRHFRGQLQRLENLLRHLRVRDARDHRGGSAPGFDGATPRLVHRGPGDPVKRKTGDPRAPARRGGVPAGRATRLPAARDLAFVAPLRVAPAATVAGVHSQRLAEFSPRDVSAAKAAMAVVFPGPAACLVA